MIKLSIISKFIKKQDDSIYSIMKKCTSNGKLDTDKFDKLINPSENDNYRINSAFLDQFGIDEDKRNEQVPQILEVINDIYNDNIKFKDLENKLEKIEFKTLNIIDALRAEINNDNYDIKTYETFKRLMYTTHNIEIFKLSVEMTAMLGKCEELLSDYLLMGQYEEFSKYVSFILCLWRQKPIFLDALFTLVDESKDWGAINYGEMLMQNQDIMADINNQRRILIGTLSRNCIPMEIAFDLASGLNINELCNISSNDVELSIAITDLYKTLFFERDCSGGILDLKNPIDYLNTYVDFIKNSEFEEMRFIGLKDMLEFLDDKENKDEIIDVYDENVYEKLKNKVYDLYDSIDVINSLRKLIKLGDNALFQSINFILKNKIYELIPDLEKRYLEGCKVNSLENALSILGSHEIKKSIYEKLKNECSHRENKEMCYDLLFGEEFKFGKEIITKMNVLSWEGAYDCKLLENLIEDYNFEIRAKALDIISKTPYYIENSNIVFKVKERLYDSPYVRRKAADVCRIYNLKITNGEKDYILNSIIQREGHSNSSSDDAFEKSLNEIMENITSSF